MKRSVAMGGALGWILLAGFSSGSHGRPYLVSSFISTSSQGSIGRRSESYPSRNPMEQRYECASARSTQHASDAYNNPTICHMSKNNQAPNNFFDSRKNKGGDNEEEQSPSSGGKRGVFKRIREKISTSFNKKGDTAEADTKKDNEYKPNPLDGLRLRLAMAMSNINLFQFGKKEEWVVACPKTRVGPGQIVPCVVNGLDIIIFASRDGQRLDAFANACPHLGSPFDLATTERKPVLEDKGRDADDGTGDGCVDCIVCPVHRTAFEIQSGQVRGEWCPYPPVLGGLMGYVKPKSSLVKFAVRLRGKNVEVRVATSVSDVGKGVEKADGVKGIK